MTNIESLWLKIVKLKIKDLFGKMRSLSEYFVNIYWSFWKKSFISNYIKVILASTHVQTRLLTRPHDRRSRPANYILTAWLFVTFWVDLFRISNFENRTTGSKVGISIGFQIPSPKKILKRTCFFLKIYCILEEIWK